MKWLISKLKTQVPLSDTLTFMIPFTSISNVTSICSTQSLTTQTCPASCCPSSVTAHPHTLESTPWAGCLPQLRGYVSECTLVSTYCPGHILANPAPDLPHPPPPPCPLNQIKGNYH